LQLKTIFIVQCWWTQWLYY